MPPRKRWRPDAHARMALANAVLDECLRQPLGSLVGRGPDPLHARAFCKLLDHGYVGLDAGEPYLTRDGRELGTEEFVRVYGERPEVVAYDELTGKRRVIDDRVPRRRITSTSTTASAIMRS